jgi:outer membrane PBP1 activator LpoA protein
LVAATAKYEAAAVDDAVVLLDMAEGGPLDDYQRAQAEVLRARIAFATNRGSDAPPLLRSSSPRRADWSHSMLRSLGRRTSMP